MCIKEMFGGAKRGTCSRFQGSTDTDSPTGIIDT